MENPQQTPLQRAIDTLLKPPHLFGVAAIILIGIASFVFVVSYLKARQPAAPTQVAAASTTLNAFVGISLQARAAMVYDITSDKVLFERNADAKLPLASITKAMLALVIAENLSPETMITIPYNTALHEGVGQLKAGERWKVSDVLKFTLITSSNEGAEILAKAAEGAIKKRYAEAPANGATLWRMNMLAREIGMTQSYFQNVSGLDLSASESGGYGSARDVARLFAYAASTSLHAFSATAENGILLADEAGSTTEARNTNEALGDIPGLIMGKTGYTDLAGGNLAVVYDIGLAHPVVAVVLGSTLDGRFEDMRELVPASRKAFTQ